MSRAYSRWSWLSLALGASLWGGAIRSVAPNGRPGGPPSDRPADAVALDDAVARAEAGAPEAAEEGFRALLGSRSPDVAAAAGFDLARLLWERQLRRTLPDAPGKRPKQNAIADARARIALIRDELSAARDALLVELRRKPRGAAVDDEWLASLAVVSERLRSVEARDLEWAEASEAAAARGGAKGPLKPGPSGAKASAGAPGQKGGSGSDADGGERPPPTAALPAGAEQGSTATSEELRERLDQARVEAAEQERRRARAARERSGSRRQ